MSSQARGEPLLTEAPVEILAFESWLTLAARVLDGQARNTAVILTFSTLASWRVYQETGKKTD
jgi:hypothetical protein